MAQACEVAQWTAVPGVGHDADHTERADGRETVGGGIEVNRSRTRAGGNHTEEHRAGVGDGGIG